MFFVSLLCLCDQKAVDGMYPCFAKQHLTEEKNFELEWLIQDISKSKDKQKVEKKVEDHDKEHENQST
jgi:hypothetical protein